MKTKLTSPWSKLFRQFKLKGRIIILCAKKDYNNIKIGMSICNPKDIFNEKLGRKIAEDRTIHKRNLFIYSICYIYEHEHIYGRYESELKITEERIKLNPEEYIKSLN